MRTKLNHPVWLFAFAGLCLSAGVFRCAPASAQERPEQLSGTEPVLGTDLFNIRRLGNVIVSPDGREVLYTVTSIVESDEDDDSLTYETHLFLADAGGQTPPRQLTRGAGATQPAWHPSGERIAFVRHVEDRPQIFVLPLLGGEAIQITSLESGASNPRWSPDGTRILFSSILTEADLRDRTGERPAWPLERPGRSPGDTEGVEPDPDGSIQQVRAWLDRNMAERDPRVINRLDFQGEHDLEEQLEFQHFFVIDADPAAEPVMITRGYNHFEDAEWLADGMRIVLAGNIQDTMHPDRIIESHLYVATADGRTLRPLLEMEDYAVFNPMPTPDGEHVAFLAMREDDWGYAQTELGLLSMEDPAGARIITAYFDRSIADAKWSVDGWYIYFTADANGGTPLYRVHPFDTERPAPYVAGEPDSTTVPADTTEGPADVSDTAEETSDPIAEPAGAEIAATDSIAADSAAIDATLGDPYPIERLTSFDRGVQSFDVGRATTFFVATSPANPYELYAANLTFTSESRITSHNAEWLADKRLSVPERYSVMNDGYEIDYWIMRPADFDPAERYPLLVQMHGGPAAMWGPGEPTMWHEFQFFAARGYAIVFANPRGSGGYGYEFQRANYQDWGAGPASDVLAAANAAAELPWVDEERQVLTGGSYAGYLTAWVVAHDDRFRAAVAQRGVYDLDTFLGEGNAWRLVPTHFGGYPWNVEGVDTLVAAPSMFGDVDSLMAARSDSSHAETLVALPPEIREAESPISSPALILEQNSPLTFVDQIDTPLLIIHADDDLRTGVVQSEMLYRSLKILEKPVEYVRYPDSGHDLSRTGAPGRRLDRILRIYEFFERFLD